VTGATQIVACPGNTRQVIFTKKYGPANGAPPSSSIWHTGGANAGLVASYVGNGAGVVN
jgi:hypothetical protein